jgi:hypothetical protein
MSALPDDLTEGERCAMAALKGAALSGRPIEVSKASTMGAAGAVNVQTALRLAQKGLVTFDMQLTEGGRRRAAFTDIACYVNPYDFDPPIPDGFRNGD